ncbi:MAG: hypothetical protein AABZ55_08485, partial [Bdellovibrionota bacterium]
CKIIFVPTAELEHLMAPMGGARVHDKARHNSYFVKNGMRLFRRHSPTILLPFFFLWMVVYSLLKAVKNRNLRIAFFGLKAAAEGLFQTIPLKV